MGPLVYIVIHISLSYLISKYIGSKRKIGFKWSIFFCLTLTPLIGIVIVILTSKKTEEEKIEPSLLKKIIGYFLIILSLFAIYSFFNPPFNRSFQNINYTLLISTTLIFSFLWRVGLLGSGLYLVKTGNGEKTESPLDSYLFKINYPQDKE